MDCQCSHRVDCIPKCNSTKQSTNTSPAHIAHLHFLFFASLPIIFADFELAPNAVTIESPSLLQHRAPLLPGLQDVAICDTKLLVDCDVSHDPELHVLGIEIPEHVDIGRAGGVEARSYEEYALFRGGWGLEVKVVPSAGKTIGLDYPGQSFVRVSIEQRIEPRVVGG